MQKLLFIIILEIWFVSYSFSQEQHQKFIISKDVEVIKITDHAYMHVSYTQLQNYGRVASNGLIFLNNDKAILFDTPMTESLTKELVEWIRDTLKVEITGFVPNHWHDDCIGGLAYLNSLGIKSYANEMTIQIAKSKNLPVTTFGFRDSLTLSIDDRKVICNYLGAAHSLDNIVVWIPSEKILFAGCMVKDIQSKNLGNTVDGDLAAYPKTIMNVLNKYHNAEFVIPGHGQFGGIELLKHTLELSSVNK